MSQEGMTRAIGKVSATENKPTSCTTVRFWVQKDVVIRPFDVVRIRHIGKTASSGSSYTYAIVQDLHYITDGAGHLANYVSYDFGDVNIEPLNRRLGTTIAEAEVLYNSQEIEMPLRDGAPVEWADAEGIKDALGLRGFRQPIPAGYLSISNGDEVPIELESAYLLGPEGAHLNIAGISGLATKTSYAMFLLNAIQQKLPDKITMVVFNVKGADLLQIDEHNPDLCGERESEWRKCGLEPKPFERVTYLYPYANRESSYFTSSHADPEALQRQREQGRAFNYFYDIESARDKLDFLFSDIEDPNATIESIVHQVSDLDVSSWKSFRRELKDRAQKGSTKAGDISIASWRRFRRLTETRTEHDVFTERAQSEAKRHILIHQAISNIRAGDVIVVDIEPLPAYLQAFVFGDVIQTIYQAKQGDLEGVDPKTLGTVVVLADELNKYAPKTSDSSGHTLTRNLLEVTERGRSLGVILFGVEQFRSGVHDRVLGNCSTNAYGRTSPVEMAKCPDYRYFPEAHRSALTRLAQGNLLLQHPVFRTSLIKVRFPYSSYVQPKPR